MENKISPDFIVDLFQKNSFTFDDVKDGLFARTYGFDLIEIKHLAHNREGFALGAVIAAEWIVDKQGVFTMKDVLNII
jgi:4-hydroxy-tetrahydrodipicolinate reductase